MTENRLQSIAYNIIYIVCTVTRVKVQLFQCMHTVLSGAWSMESRMTELVTKFLRGGKEAAIWGATTCKASFLHSRRRVIYIFVGSQCAVFTEMSKKLGVLQHPQAPTCLRPCIVGPCQLSAIQGLSHCWASACCYDRMCDLIGPVHAATGQ